MPITLGLDCSTQSLSALIIDSARGQILVDESLNFGKDLPQFQSPNGYLESDDKTVVHANPLMWLEAVDVLLNRIKQSGFDFAKIDAVSGAGQQHGSVYLNNSFQSVVESLDSNQSLADQLAPSLSRETSPIWMDSSTEIQCEEIADAVEGGAKEISRRTGSIPTKRFTGPQIRRFYQTDPAAYEVTSRIHLVSSFLSSVLSGSDSAIDPGDGAGMNLMNLASQVWDQDLLDATAPGLATKLPAVETSRQIVGPISKYFVTKYGFSSDCQCVVWTGDNPSSLVGMGAALPGKVVISLGTSDTLFTSLSKPVTDPAGIGHVFGNPWGNCMSLVCFSSGSLTRERLKDSLQLGWDDFERAAEVLPQVTSEMLPFFEATTSSDGWSKALDSYLEKLQPLEQIRLLLEWQFLTMAKQSEWMQTNFDTVYVTGGASVNRGICQTIADVFDAKVRRLESSNSSCLGGAMRAAESLETLDHESLVNDFCRISKESEVLPRPNSVLLYQGLA